MEKAADACLYIINLSQYYDLDMTNEADLAPDSWENYYRRFLGRYFLVGKESIWISYELENWGGVKIPWGNRSTGCWNWVNPTYELAMEFEMLDGTMPKDGGNYDLKIRLKEETEILGLWLPYNIRERYTISMIFNHGLAEVPAICKVRKRECVCKIYRSVI